jgi:hypothetical protein
LRLKTVAATPFEDGAADTVAAGILPAVEPGVSPGGCGVPTNLALI